MDESLSPDKILSRLEELRKWQKVQEKKLLEQQTLQRKQFAENQTKLYYEKLNLSNKARTDSDINWSIGSSNIYRDENGSSISEDYSESHLGQIHPSDLIEGISVLNISSESELYLTQTPKSEVSSDHHHQHQHHRGSPHIHQYKPIVTTKNLTKLPIHLDEIPILGPPKDFETLIEETLRKTNPDNDVDKISLSGKPSRPFLRRGQGLARFKMSSEDIGLARNVKLPWTKPKVSLTKLIKTESRPNHNNIVKELPSLATANVKEKPKLSSVLIQQVIKKSSSQLNKKYSQNEIDNVVGDPSDNQFERKNELEKKTNEIAISEIKQKCWASVFTEDREEYLKLLRQTKACHMQNTTPDKNYMSSDSCTSSPYMDKIMADKEKAEQRVFELLEKRVDNSSFCSTNNYFKVNQSGDDTPTQNTEFLQYHPHVRNLKPHWKAFRHSESFYSSKESVTVDSPYSEPTRRDTQNRDEGEEEAYCTHENMQESEDYTESTDTEETQMLQKIVSSTPNQPSTDNCQADENTKKIIKIVIRKNNTDDSDFTVENIDRTCIEDKTLKNDDLNSEAENNGSAYDMEELPDFVSKTELLKVRLEELEEEIAIFRSENEKFSQLRRDLEIQKEIFYDEKANTERKLSEEKIMNEYFLAEEKEKLSKQKLMYDRHVKEMKGQSAKKDREEMAVLRKELNDLKDQTANKDARSGAAQARLRNQLKNLEKENAELKTECVKLKKENKRINTANTRTRRLSNIKSLAEINKSLAQMTINNKMTDVEIEDVYPDKKISSEFLSGDKYTKRKKREVSKPAVISRAKSVPNLSTTSHYAKYFSKKDEELRRDMYDECGYGLDSESESDHTDVSDTKISRDMNYSHKTSNNSEEKYDRINISDTNKNPYNIEDTICDSNHRSYDFQFPSLQTDGIEQMYKEKFDNPNSKDSIPTTFENFKNINQINTPQSTPNHSDDPPIHKSVINQDKVDIMRPDGCREIRFANGNTKICSADGMYCKFTYYNGDIKETFYNEGTIKYFYKEVDVHHTTYRDGSQVLQFPDGHIERRYKDGSVEAHLPGGTTRWSKPDGSEEWSFPDGTLVMVNPSGDQTLRFPNGQTEVHTSDFKRREFPDGTVKVVYADGVVETRYANGRIRVKDKQGNLVMDSATRLSGIPQT